MNFKKGDRVKIIGNNKIPHSHEIGEIGTIISIDPLALDVQVGTQSQWVEFKDVKKIRRSNNPT